MRKRMLSGLLLAVVVPVVTAAPPVQASMAQPVIASESPATTTPHAIDDATVSNAAVNTLTQVGSVMYAGGGFRTVQSPDRSVSYTRYNLFSFDVSTGIPTSWTPNVNKAVLATTAHGNYLYVGGFFTSADGVSRRLVRYDLTTLTIDRTWRPAGINAPVTDLEVVDGRLIVAGQFTKRLVALDLTTGADTGYLSSVLISGTYGTAHPGRVYRFAVSPDGTKLVGVGNFTSVVEGEKVHRRYRAFMLDLGATSATVNPWYYKPLENLCATGTRRPDYLRDVDFSPDGSYFVIVSTGFVVAHSSRLGLDLCDAAARFETGVTDPARPTWINYTGGDTLHSVAVVGAAVYVGGHQRWLDNPFGRDTCGTGCVSRPGVGALDPSTGKALPWNPTKTRANGTMAIYPTATGVWFGSDGRHFNRKVRDSIAFTPLS